VYNCCRHNWQIRVDKETYNKYASLADDTGKEFLDSIKILSEEPFIAVIIANKEGHCNFLDDKGFCKIQLKLGHNYLCRTCMFHPRSINYADGEFERYLELSCEEAVRAVLFNDKPIMFEEANLKPDGNGNYIPNLMLKTEDYTTAANAGEIFTKLRKASVSIVQNRQYSVRVRMLLLCILIEQANQLFANGLDSDVIKTVDEFMKAIRSGVYNSIANEMPDGLVADFSIVTDILTDMQNKNDDRFNAIMEQAFKGHGLPFNKDELPASFQEEYDNNYDRFFADKEYIFENYLVNNIMMKGFPFNYGKDHVVIANFADLMVKFNIIEFLLVGLCKFHDTFDEWNIINCVSAFSRRYDHSEKGFLMMG